MLAFWAAALGERSAQERWERKFGSHDGLAIHPSREEVWSHGYLLDLKTGEQISQISRSGLKYRALDHVEWVVWADGDHVLEAVEKVGSAEANDTEQRPAMLALWNVRTKQLEASVEAPYVSAIASAPDGSKVLEGGSDKRVRIRDGKTLNVESEARVHDLSVKGLAWHPSKPLIATASSDGMIRIWNRMDWSLVEELRTGDSRYWNLQISPSGKRLLASSQYVGLAFEPKSFQD